MMRGAQSTGAAGSSMRLLRGLLVLCMLVCASTEGGSSLLPKFTGTWLGTAGSLVGAVIHGGTHGSIVGSALFGSGSSHCQFGLVYASQESDDGAVGLRGDKLYCYYTENWPSRNFTVQAFEDKLLVDVLTEEGTTPFALVRKDDGTVAKGECNPSAAQKLKATLEKDDCKKSKAG